MSRHTPALLGIVAILIVPVSAVAQSSFPSGGSPMPANVAPSLPGANPVPNSTLPGGTNFGAGNSSGGLSPLPPRSSLSTPNPPSVSLGNPTFDVYNNGNAPGTYTPAVPNQQPVPPNALIPGSAAVGSLFSGWPGSNVTGSATGYSATNPPPVLSPAPSYGSTYPNAAYPPAAGGAGAYPSSIYPNSSPPVLIPNGMGPYGTGGYSGNYYNPFGEFTLPGAVKFIQGPRFSHGWLAGGDGPVELGVNETQVSVAFAFPNFLWSGQPIYVLPSFSLDLWDGPSNGTADLPASAYEAFLDFGWQTNPNQIIGLETGFRIGVFSDFDTFNSDSMRYIGKVIGNVRLTPRLTAKLGVMYIDRIEVGVIPAGGFLWQPTPYSRWDIYFPEPKYSRYCSTVGTQDIWWYVAGEYGGGSWTISRTSGAEDRVDVNDMRLLTGFEFGRSDLLRTGRRTAFVEAGWVFDREIVYDTTPGSTDLDSTFILRAGFGY